MPLDIVAGQRIPSSARRLLVQELRSYGLGTSAGRSFLIAGHRGAGKTALVRHAIAEVTADPRWTETQQRRRFLPIEIHGPSLFALKTRRADDGAALPQAANERELNERELMESTLRQMVLSLYRGLVDEVAIRYRDRATEHCERTGDPELLERAAQLRIELDEYPGPERLREFWAAGDFLRRGVLFRDVVGDPVFDQGLRELVALCTACEAFRFVSGTFEQMKQEAKVLHEQSRVSGINADSTGKNLITPLIALVTGGLVGVGSATTAGGSSAIGIAAGLAAALGTSVVFKYASERKRTRSYAREYTFLPDHDVSTLERAVPALVERVSDAGLIPVFIVEELDKVANLAPNMRRMLGQLKKLVSEKTFFCFLTNRDYYEHLQSRSLIEAYPIEHTYFSDRVFVVFHSDDFHSYLDNTFVVTAPLAPPDDSAIASADREVLPYILLQRAQMHPIDVRRQIDEIRGHGNQGNQVGLAPGSVRSRSADQFDLMIQLGIRMVLDRLEIRNAMQRDPAFARLAHDALYLPSRKRRAGHYDLDLSDDGETAFRGEIERRMVTAEAEDAGSPPAPLSQTDSKFLYSRVRELAELLADPFAYSDAMDAWEADTGQRLGVAVRDALPFLLPSGPLLSTAGPHRYRWGYDHLGRDVQQ
jgi:hypothetical protein